MLDNLIKKFTDGDQSAFEELYNQTQKSVYYTALAILRDKALAEDVVQATYLSVLKNISRYQFGTNAAAWIVRIAKNEALNVKKARGRELYFDDSGNDGFFGTYQPDDYGAMIDLARRILTEDEFMIVMFVTSCGYKRREIAKMMSVPTSTVTWKYNSALDKMRKCLEQ